MISYTEAFIKANEIREEIDSCIEYENGYVFCSDKGEDQVGGYYSPIEGPDVSMGFRCERCGHFWTES